MDSEIHRIAQTIAMSGILMGKDKESILIELESIGLTAEEANNFLITVLAATDVAQLGKNLDTDIRVVHESFQKQKKVSTLNDIVFFEVPIPSEDRLLCSDNKCPCSGDESLEPGKTGLLYISKEVVSMREDAITWDELQRKLTAIKMQLKTHMFIDGGVVNPIVICEQGARLRNLDLKVAAADAEHWINTGLCPLRPTPTVKKWWQFWR